MLALSRAASAAWSARDGNGRRGNRTMKPMTTTQRLRKAISLVPNYVVWIVATLVTLLPIYWMIVVSARSRVELFDAPTLEIKSFFVQNYTDVITNTVYQRYMLNSVIIST